MNKKHVDLLLTALCMACGIYIIVVSRDINFYEKLFPYIIGFGLIITSCFLLYSTVTKGDVDKIEKKNYALVAMMLIILVLYVILLQHAGYIISTALLSAIILYILGYQSRIKLVLISLAITLTIYVLFKMVLNVPLPSLLI